MKKSNLIIFILLGFCFQLFLGSVIHNAGATNFDRLVLGSGNYGLDPNPTADITGANGEYISNASNGSWNFGSANLTTSGIISSGSTVLNDSLQGKLFILDSLRVGKTAVVVGNLYLRAGITGGTLTRGTHAFTTTATEDTVTISGAGTGDIYIVSMQYNAGVDQQDVLEWEALSGKLVVHRLASGETGAKWSWWRIQ